MAYNVRRRPLSREKAFLCRTGRGIPHPHPIGVLLFARPGVGAVTLALLTRNTVRCFRNHPGATTTLTDILVDVLGGRMAVSGRDGKAGQDVLRRAGEASVLILISLADGPKHGYALIQDIKELAGVELGPGTLYGALDRLERLGLIEPLPADDRRHPYRITAPGAAALRVHLDSLERVSAAGRLRLRLGGV